MNIDVPDSVKRRFQKKTEEASLDELLVKARKEWAMNDLTKKKPWLRKETRNAGNLNNLKNKGKTR